ncbi:MAG: chromosomal replication initiator protein DnaA [Opitutales bacterium]|nr:chromosomal replication initiator protein DnaA [Opitutales bacterium]MCH8539673.1 chromosomal replication initiator protein DnaA [Opitutales bacterium]
MPTLTNTLDLWKTVKQDLAAYFPADVFQMWFEPLDCLSLTDEEIVLGAPNDFASIWIKDNYLDVLKEKIHTHTENGVAISFTVREEKKESNSRLSQVNTNTAPATNRNGSSSTMARKSPRSDEKARTSTFLNPRNTFDSFVIGSGNQLAHAASLAVAQAPGKAYNPLFLYGGNGLGKTHLMHAVGHQMLQNRPDSRIAYVSSEKFTNEFIMAIQQNTLSRFRRQYREADILLIDDIHFLSGKERCQEEFFHTFNDLFESGKQIFLSSDRPANEIAKLENRLISRFQWGLVADIQTPDYETRLAILKTKAQAQRLNLPEEVVEFIAQRISQNIRRLEGALLKLSSYHNLIGGTLDIPSVERLLQDLLQEEAQRQVTIEMIQKKVVDFYKLRVSDMVSRRRPNNIAFPRQIAMYLSRILTNQSLSEIGEAFGGRDHGTVLHAFRTIQNYMEQDESTRNNVEYLKKSLEKGGS